MFGMGEPLSCRLERPEISFSVRSCSNWTSNWLMYRNSTGPNTSDMGWPHSVFKETVIGINTRKELVGVFVRLWLRETSWMWIDRRPETDVVGWIEIKCFNKFSLLTFGRINFRSPSSSIGFFPSKVVISNIFTWSPLKFQHRQGRSLGWAGFLPRFLPVFDDDDVVVDDDDGHEERSEAKVSCIELNAWFTLCRRK